MENWGDFQTEEESENGDIIHPLHRRATIFLATMKKKVPDHEWTRIVDGARAYAAKSSESAGRRRSGGLSVEEPEEVLFDDPSWGPAPGSDVSLPFGPSTTSDDVAAATAAPSSDSI